MCLHPCTHPYTLEITQLSGPGHNYEDKYIFSFAKVTPNCFPNTYALFFFLSGMFENSSLTFSSVKQTQHMANLSVFFKVLYVNFLISMSLLQS